MRQSWLKHAKIAYPRSHATYQTLKKKNDSNGRSILAWVGNCRVVWALTMSTTKEWIAAMAGYRMGDNGVADPSFPLALTRAMAWIWEWPDPRKI